MERSLRIVNECMSAGSADASRQSAVYRRSDPKYAMTLQLIEGRDIVYEGVPGVGKTTLMHSTHEALLALGGASRAHEEAPDKEMLAQFFKDPQGAAFWFQCHKLHRRQMLALQITHSRSKGVTGDGIPETLLVDRNMPGDLAFTLYNHMMGNINDDQLRIYMQLLREHQFRRPFLVIYMTADPECLVARIRVRGNADEMAAYTLAYFQRMDACYRAALDLTGCHYCIVDWGKDLPGVMGTGAWSAQRGRVPVDKCMEVIEHAIAATYGNNIARINRMRNSDTVKIGVAPADRMLYVNNDERDLDKADPDDLMRDAGHLLLKYSGQYSGKSNSTDESEGEWETVY